MLNIRQADEGDIPALYDLYAQIGQKDEGDFEALFGKDCIILIASKSTSSSSCGLTTGSHKGGRDTAIKSQYDGAFVDVGFGILNFEPKYTLYKKLEIPEIQDLNVIPDARQQGIATALVEAFEDLTRDQGLASIGISVGLTKDYGPAQRLYCKLGYMPDGNGIAYDRECVTYQQSYPADDDLCLMMIKDLRVHKYLCVEEEG